MRVSVLGEGKSERLRKERGDVRTEVGTSLQGAGELLVCRVLERSGLSATIVEPGKFTGGEGDVIKNGNKLARVTIATIPTSGPLVRQGAKLADLLVVLCDKDLEGPVSSAIEQARRVDPGAKVNLIHLVADPEIEALLSGDKGAVEGGLGITPCHYKAAESLTKEAFADACQAAGFDGCVGAKEKAEIARRTDATRLTSLPWAGPLVEWANNEKGRRAAAFRHEEP